ncbi:MAG TPA: hypothetical protein VMF50_13520 [Candidatus Binataceae bacterium]|nr:hypothetical protein [Candidatus Binataceae bacterium]
MKQCVGGKGTGIPNKEPLQLPRHIAWRRQYDMRRYARHLSQAELNQRIRDILLNLLGVNAEGQLSLEPLWAEKWTHVLEEMQLRHGPYPAGFTRETLHSDPEPFPDFASELAYKAALRLSSIGLNRGSVFIKFGERKYMEPLYESGALRIQPATYFAQSNHNGAVRDNELMLSVSLALSRDDIVKVVTNPQNVPSDAPEQRLDVKFESPTDYWVYCVTNSLKPRLFVDFKADACVIIRDRARFSRMLSDSSRLRLRAAAMFEGPAVYVDPLLPITSTIFVPFAKYFGYSYQDEQRFCWLPSVPVKKVTYLDLQIGSLKEFSDLIVL